MLCGDAMVAEKAGKCLGPSKAQYLKQLHCSVHVAKYFLQMTEFAVSIGKFCLFAVAMELECYAQLRHKCSVFMCDTYYYCMCASCITHSLSYLKQIAGSRTVPVELGSRYTDEDWSQKLMTLAEFIDAYVDTKVGYRVCVAID